MVFRQTFVDHEDSDCGRTDGGAGDSGDPWETEEITSRTIVGAVDQYEAWMMVMARVWRRISACAESGGRLEIQSIDLDYVWSGTVDPDAYIPSGYPDFEDE